MLVYLNRKPKSGPWGGGIKTVGMLYKSLIDDGHEVTFKLDRPGIDILFCFDPRPNESGEWYQNFLDYRNNFGSKIVQRVGDIGTHSKPDLTNLVRTTIPLSDFVFHISDWAREKINSSNDNEEVVYLAPPKMFYGSRKKDFKPGEKTKVITHHWSNNPKKGGDFYKKFDNFLKDSEEFEFTFMGRISPDIEFKNSTYISPQPALEVSRHLSNNHVYLTASIEEAGGNHCVEALAVGLPIVYHNLGGGIVDFCKDYGYGYSSFEEMIEKIKKTKKNYSNLKSKALEYNDTLEGVCERYVNIMKSLVKV